MTPAEAKQRRDALEVLRAVPNPSPEVQSAIASIEAQLPQIEAEVGATRATYRGVGQGLSLGAADEGAGVVSMIRGDGYAQGRDTARETNAQLRAAYPDEFAKGELGGTLMTAAIPATGLLNAAKGAGLGTKMALSGLLGGSIAGGQGFMQGEGGFLPRMANAALPAAVGAGIGILSPALGQVAGGLVRGVQGASRRVAGMHPGATGRVAGALNRRITADAGDVEQYLQSLGPEGMIADVPGGPRTIAQGMAAMPGPAKDRLTDSIETRAAGAAGRIRSDVDEVIGSADAAFNERRALAAERTNKLGPEYDAALNAGPVDVTDTLAIIERSLRTAGPDSRAALQKYYDDLSARAENGVIDAESLHWLRSDINDAISEGPTKVNALLKNARDAIDEDLNTIAGYREARTGYANNKAMERAIEEGRKVFRGGEASALSPRQLKEMMDKMSDAERAAFRTGAREQIDAIMGTARNDAASAWQTFQKEWNDEKLRIILGDKQAERVLNRVNAEQTFSATRGDVLKGSQTAMRDQAAKDLADLRPVDGTARPGPIGRVRQGVNDAVNPMIDAVLYGPRRSAANADIGRILTAQGPERDGLLAALLREAEWQRTPNSAQMVADGLLSTGLLAGSAPLAQMIAK